VIHLFNNRLILERRKLSENWRCRIRLGPNPEQQVEVDLFTPDLRTAFIRSNNIYQAFRRGQRLEPLEEPEHTGKRCWDCNQWVPTLTHNGGNGCSLGFPEAKSYMNGRFANLCSLYSDGTESLEPD
jgi:hypothetical protein